VVFHEDSIYFSRSDLPGEYQDELQTLYYEVHMPTDVLPNNQNESSRVDTSMNMDLYIYIYIYIPLQHIDCQSNVIGFLSTIYTFTAYCFVEG